VTSNGNKNHGEEYTVGRITWGMILVLVITLLVIIGAVWWLFGLKEGLMALGLGILGFFGIGKCKDDGTKQRLEEAKKVTDEKFEAVRDKVEEIREQQVKNDREVEQRVEDTKAKADAMSDDDLIALGNDMLRRNRDSGG